MRYLALNLPYTLTGVGVVLETYEDNRGSPDPEDPSKV